MINRETLRVLGAISRKGFVRRNATSSAPTTPAKLEVFVDDKKVLVDPGMTILQVLIFNDSYNDWYRFQARIGIPPEDMASGNPENPGFGWVTDPPSPLGFGRVIHESLRLGETRRLVPVSSPNRDSTGRYGFRKSGKSWIWLGHRSSVAARIWACDT
ncbi:NADH Ubiquinone Oxidoreductase [Ditylenchus destructor]|uniref:NADH Ubiquinone Oxidoreductase n=1 Tax=Ditylenchus destructor TaxID=166010 RepID=A0AAD4NAG2_9BILA|nr:NADH Ubiquinone Oxidoreductase [Ditylenchus destructor]